MNSLYNNRTVAVHVAIAPDCMMKAARAAVIRNQLLAQGAEVWRTDPDIDADEYIERDNARVESVCYYITTHADDSSIVSVLLSIVDVLHVKIVPLPVEKERVPAGVPPVP